MSGTTYVAPLLDALHARGFKPATCAMDKGCSRLQAVVGREATRQTGPSAVDRPLGRGATDSVGKRGVLSDQLDRSRPRAAVEREFGRLKNEYGLTPLRTRGLARVRQHANLVMIARLGQALVEARAVPLAA